MRSLPKLHPDLGHENHHIETFLDLFGIRCFKEGSRRLCRVQRYFVEEMFKAIEDSGQGRVTATFDKLIPRRAECCRFMVELLKDESGVHPWSEYSTKLQQRALQKKDETRL